jgi:hypothetical protein
MKAWHLVVPCSVLAAGSLMAQVAQVPTIYSTANDLLRVKGRAVTDPVASGGASTLYALFNRDTAAAIAQGDLKAFLLQDRAGLFGSAVGLPLAFTNCLADGRHVDRGEPLQGQFIRSE